MKKLALIIFALSCVESFSASCWMNTNTQRMLWSGRPEVVTVGGVAYSGHPTDAMLEAGGWVRMEFGECDQQDVLFGWEPSAWVRCMTQDEIDQRTAEQAQAALTAEAAELERLRPRYEAENAFLLRATQISQQFGVDLGASDSYQSALYKLKEATQGERLDRIEAGVELRTLWDVVLFHGGKWGAVQWHPEAESPGD